MSDLATRYGKEMICAETAYAFTPDDGDKQGNPFIVYSDETCGYRPSVQGQATAVRDVIEAVASVKGGLGTGMASCKGCWTFKHRRCYLGKPGNV